MADRDSRELKVRGKKANTAIAITAHRMGQIVWRVLKERRPFTEQKPEPPSPAAPVKDGRHLHADERLGSEWSAGDLALSCAALLGGHAEKTDHGIGPGHGKHSPQQKGTH